MPSIIGSPGAAAVVLRIALSFKDPPHKRVRGATIDGGVTPRQCVSTARIRPDNPLGSAFGYELFFRKQMLEKWGDALSRA